MYVATATLQCNKQTMSCPLLSVVVVLVVLSGTTNAQGVCDSSIDLSLQCCVSQSSAVTPTTVYVRTLQSFEGVPTDPECSSGGPFDDSRSCNVPNHLTDGVLGVSSPVNFNQFSAWSRTTTPMPRIYFQFPNLDNLYIRQIDLYFYENAALGVGLPDVRLHVASSITTIEGLFFPIPYTIISNQSISGTDNQTVKVSLVDIIDQSNALLVDNVLVRMTFNFNNSDTLDWMLISEVMMFTDTGECNDHDHVMSK